MGIAGTNKATHTQAHHLEERHFSLLQNNKQNNSQSPNGILIQSLVAMPKGRCKASRGGLIKFVRSQYEESLKLLNLDSLSWMDKGKMVLIYTFTCIFLEGA